MDNKQAVTYMSPYHTPKMKWSKHEDEQLIKAVNENGAKNWPYIATFLPGRNGKQCRERWLTNLSPDVNLEPWTAEEDLKLIHLHKKYQNKWSTMTSSFEGRSAIAIKNRWKYLLKRGVPQFVEANENNHKTHFLLPKLKTRRRKKEEKKEEVVSIDNFVLQIPDKFEPFNDQDIEEIAIFDEWLVF